MCDAEEAKAFIHIMVRLGRTRLLQLLQLYETSTRPGAGCRMSGLGWT